eukprot:g3721.t1
MTDRLNAIGTQASLIGGFVVTALTAVTAQDPNVSPIARDLFWISSALALAASIHCILNATFLAIWGPGLALRGPDGSVSKAFHEMRNETRHIQISYTIAVSGFTVQAATTFFILDGTPGWTIIAFVCCGIIGIYFALTAFAIFRIRNRFFKHMKTGGKMKMQTSGKKYLAGNKTVSPLGKNRHRRSLQGKRKRNSYSLLNAIGIGKQSPADDQTINQYDDGKEPLLRGNKAKGGGTEDSGNAMDNSMTVRNKSLSPSFLTGKQRRAYGSSLSPSTTTKNHLPMRNYYLAFSHRGYLLKKGRLSSTWVRRYFVLASDTLYSFRTQEDYENGENPSKQISLKGYEVMVYGNLNLMFMLVPLNRDLADENSHQLLSTVFEDDESSTYSGSYTPTTTQTTTTTNKNVMTNASATSVTGDSTNQDPAAVKKSKEKNPLPEKNKEHIIDSRIEITQEKYFQMDSTDDESDSGYNGTSSSSGSGPRKFLRRRNSSSSTIATTSGSDGGGGAWYSFFGSTKRPRQRYFKAESDEDLIDWVRALVAATLIAQ